MSLFAATQAQATTLKVTERDSVGGGFTLPSGVFASGIKMMYLDKVASGALFVSVEVAALVNGKEMTHKENIFISNKAGELTYKDKQDGSDQPMPGFATIDSLCRLATGKGYAEQTVETKQVKVYDYTAKAEVPMAKDVFMSMLGQKVKLGIICEIVDKNKKNESTGQYEPTGETRKQNVISKVFSLDTEQTLTEIAANQPAAFVKVWAEKFEGKEINKAKGKQAASGAVAGNPLGGATAGADPLFG